ncbi:hypothetical protein NAT47_09025 [Flavobacterium sp. HXWNR69]|uniref:WG repeat-containing protein n=1 Tax=Flavobacterium fragile TaxID=2949085 RepID=A0ABT0THV5_9FLAO|nr:hypothetical protein [Flavobacterium sp. HXWNR69]MCL9770560.1 hypothetical protein [Flavobacterium sp. HXWNR69]
MIKLLYIVLSLFPILSFGQQTYKVTEGELQFIVPGKGIIIKKDNQFFEMKLNVLFNKSKKSIETKLQPISEESLKLFCKGKSLVSYSDIRENHDFNDLQKISFNYIDRFSIDDKKYDEYKLYLINKNFFAYFTNKYEDKNKYTDIEEYMPFIIIEFENKKIIYTYDNEELFIIPTHKLYKIIHQYDSESKEFKTEKLKISNEEIYKFSQHAFHDLEDEFFVVDTLPSKKVRLKNIHNEILISEAYDSIVLSSIIKCFNKNKMDLYNLSFNKINKFPVQASKGHLGSIQILEKNKLKWIDWTGKEIKKGFSYPIVLLPEAPQHEYKYELAISKSNEKFILKARNMDVFGLETNTTEIDTLSLTNAFGIKNFYFENNNSKDTISSNQEFYHFDNFKTRITEMVDFSYNVIYFQRDNGTFGMSYLGNFYANNADFKKNIASSEFNNFNEYQELQFVEFKYPFYKMKKNNLFKLFPLHKEFRYKKLEDFQGNFARFELPNGKKGWLSKEGKEYLDE